MIGKQTKDLKLTTKLWLQSLRRVSQVLLQLHLFGEYKKKLTREDGGVISEWRS